MSERVLVISPHPDDEAIGCGGTLRKHVVDGSRIRVLFLTSGERGGHGLAQEETRRRREQESRDSAAILGTHEIEFWRERDGALRASRRLIERMASAIDSYKPQLIYVPNDLEAHSDHRAASRAIKTAQTLINFRPVVLMYEVWTPLTEIHEVVDITPYIDAKLAAIRAYASQCDVLRFDDAFLGLARYRGEMFCWPKDVVMAPGKYSEVFKRLAC